MAGPKSNPAGAVSSTRAGPCPTPLILSEKLLEALRANIGERVRVHFRDPPSPVEESLQIA